MSVREPDGTSSKNDPMSRKINLPRSKCKTHHFRRTNFNDDTAITEIGEKKQSILTTKTLVKFTDPENLTVDFEEYRTRKNPIPWLVIYDGAKGRSKKTWNYKEIFQLMMQTNIGIEKMLKYENCSKELTAILKEFHRNHEKFHYFAELRTIPTTKKKKGKKSNLISMYQFQKYFARVFYKVIPMSLFGSHRNVKKVRKVLKAYYIAPVDTKISLVNFLNGLNISSIQWLRPIMDESTRWSVLLKVTKWMFEKYFSAILTHVFKIQKSLCNKQKVFIRSELWRESSRQYAQNEEKKGALERVKWYSNNGRSAPVTPGRLVLIAKPTGFRPICDIKYSKTAEAEVTYLQTLLKQIYNSRYKERTGLNAMYAAWRSYANMDENEDRQLNVVACDVHNAFGSIDQTKLFDMINTMFNNLPDVLQLQWFLVFKKCGYETKIRFYRWFGSCSLPFRQSSNLKKIRYYKDKTARIEKEMLLYRIKDYIFNQTFISGKYKLKRGICQGSKLSPILAEIYYEEVSDQAFRNFKGSGKLFRFVDDFLYMTKDQHQAQGFLAAVRKGMPEYNCSFSIAKTQTNVKSPFYRRSVTINYLGYRMNGTTLDVNPIYNNDLLQYSPTLSKVAKTNALRILSDQLNLMKPFKLNWIILDPKINSKSAIFKNVELASKKMAVRCILFISAIFENPAEFRTVIMEKIKIAATRLGLILQWRLPGKKKRNAVRVDIGRMIWRSIFKVFYRNVKFREIFCKDIKLAMKDILKKG